MARTVQHVIDRARAAINDAGGVRADDIVMRGYVVDGINIIRQARPDLFIGKFSTAYESVELADAIPLDSQYFLPLAMFVGAMTEHQDEESADRARGELLAKVGGGFM